MITETLFKDIGSGIEGCLKDYKDAINEAFLRSGDEDGVTLRGTIKIVSGMDGPEADISLSFTTDKVTIKKKIYSSNGKQREFDFSGPDPTWTDDDLRTFYHCRYMAFGDLSKGFEKYLKENMPEVSYSGGSYYRGDKRMNYKAVGG